MICQGPGSKISCFRKAGTNHKGKDGCFQRFQMSKKVKTTVAKLKELYNKLGEMILRRTKDKGTKFFSLCKKLIKIIKKDTKPQQ